MTDEQQRLKDYLDELHPMVLQLREHGWPAEAYVQAEGGKLVVWMKMDVRDPRWPTEAAETET